VRVYLTALETRFWTSRRSRLRSVWTVSDEGTMRQRQFLFAGHRLEVGADLAQQSVEPEHGVDRLHRAGVEPRNVEHRAEDRLDRFQRGFDVLRGLAGSALAAFSISEAQ
jgi:hypothetical protein